MISIPEAARADFDAGIHQKNAFKPDEMVRFQVALVRLGLEKRGEAFGADEVPETAYTDQGTPGCAVAVLRAAHVIERTFVSHPEKGIMGGTRLSVRGSRNAARVNLWTLVSVSMAEEFLKRHGALAKPQQAEFSFERKVAA